MFLIKKNVRNFWTSVPVPVRPQFKALTSVFFFLGSLGQSTGCTTGSVLLWRQLCLFYCFYLGTSEWHMSLLWHTLSLCPGRLQPLILSLKISQVLKSQVSSTPVYKEIIVSPFITQSKTVSKDVAGVCLSFYFVVFHVESTLPTGVTQARRSYRKYL